MIHFLLMQLLVTSLQYLILFLYGKNAEDVYNQSVLGINGIGNLLILIWAFFQYRKDFRNRMLCGVLSENKRKFLVTDAVFLFFIGAVVAAFANFALSFFSELIHMTEYSERVGQFMDGKSFFFLLVTMGILGPAAEEMVFRGLIFLRLRDYVSVVWAAVFSGVLFGVYHGNLAQAIYAAFLGILFACFVEWTGSILAGIFLHIGANCWTLWMSEYGMKILIRMRETELLGFLAVGAVLLSAGLLYYRNQKPDGMQRKI